MVDQYDRWFYESSTGIVRDSNRLKVAEGVAQDADGELLADAPRLREIADATADLVEALENPTTAPEIRQLLCSSVRALLDEDESPKSKAPIVPPVRVGSSDTPAGPILWQIYAPGEAADALDGAPCFRDWVAVFWQANGPRHVRPWRFGNSEAELRERVRDLKQFPKLLPEMGLTTRVEVLSPGQPWTRVDPRRAGELPAWTVAWFSGDRAISYRYARDYDDAQRISETEGPEGVRCG